jgi:hypothetical protein
MLLTKGLPAVLFWFTFLVLYILIFAAIAKNWSLQRIAPLAETGFDLGAAFCFFITLTTVGLGDRYIPHDSFSWENMFYLPLLILLGFVWLANFAVKLSELILILVPAGASLENLLDKEEEEAAFNAYFADKE